MQIKAKNSNSTLQSKLEKAIFDTVQGSFVELDEISDYPVYIQVNPGTFDICVEDFNGNSSCKEVPYCLDEDREALVIGDYYNKEDVPIVEWDIEFFLEALAQYAVKHFNKEDFDID